MTFHLQPLLETMISLYEAPASPDRFQQYLKLLRGNTKDDMVLPIAGFNPMAKPHVLEQLQALKSMELEEKMSRVLEKINTHARSIKSEAAIQVFFCLSDDLKGGWTHQCAADFDSKFKINAFVQRNFCVVYFWTSESVTDEIIQQRTIAYALRTMYWQGRERMRTLKEMVEQELFVQKEMAALGYEVIGHRAIEALKKETFYQEYEDCDKEAVLLNFFYGDQAVKELGHPGMGMKEAFF